jgi:hypothetical protein
MPAVEAWPLTSRVASPGRGEAAVRPAVSAARAGQTSAGQEAAAEAPAGTRLAPAWLQWVTFLLALAGLAAATYLTYTHFTESRLLGCSESGLVNCQKVTTSPQSYVAGSRSPCSAWRSTRSWSRS